jgi:uncharacterized protein
MQYTDRIYENFTITEPVILALIHSPTVQRLKYIDLAGYIEPYFPGCSQTRFEHSLGVYLLLKIYQAPLEEQIAGLLHDISHSAFSHCIDYVLESGSETAQDLQDNIFAKFILSTEIPELLDKHNIDISYILDHKNFPLEERDLPALCADRIDYSLRCAVVFKEISAEKARLFLQHLQVENKEWFFDDVTFAKQFAELFTKLNQTYFSGLPSAIMFRTLGDYLRHGLQKNYISKKDLYTTDQEVLTKLEIHHQHDTKLKILFDRLNKKIDCSNNPQSYDSIVHCKSRVVDPLCYHAKQIKPLSAIDSSWQEIIKQESQPKKYFLKFAQ